MSFTLAIAMIAVLDLGLLALLAFVMGLPARLTPHRHRPELVLAQRGAHTAPAPVGPRRIAA